MLLLFISCPRAPSSRPVLTSCPQTEDDLAEKLRSNDMLQQAISTYREAAELPDATADLLRAALRRRAERQQFLGNDHAHAAAAAQP